MSIAVSLYGFGASDVSSFFSLSSGTFLFGGLFFDAVGFAKKKADASLPTSTSDFRFKRSAETVKKSEPYYGDLYIPKTNLIKRSPADFSMYDKVESFVKVEPQRYVSDNEFDAMCKAKGNAYEMEIAELLKRACMVFGGVNSYRLNAGSLTVNPRGIREKYDEKIDISFRVRDSLGRERVGAIQCKNWDSAYEAQKEYVHHFLGSASSMDRDFVHTFFICNSFDTINGIEKARFKSVNFVVIPSIKRCLSSKVEALNDLAMQIAELGRARKMDFGAEFSLALLHAKIYETQERGF